MALTPTLNSVEALFRKLERELYRAYHSQDPIHVADHFYNFCVTAHSMRDYFLERIGEIAGNKRQAYESEWKSTRCLVAIEEITNSAKHFQLRERKTKAPRTPDTKSVRRVREKRIDVYVNESGDLALETVSAPSISVVLSDGTRLFLYEFMSEVVAYWRTFLAMHKIKVRRQPLSRLIGKGA